MAQQQYPKETQSVIEGPELGQTSKPFVPARSLNSDYPLIDSDPHFKRVVGYARGSDYIAATAFAASGPALMYWWERISPSEVGRGGFAQIMRLSGFISVTAGFMLFYSRSINRFYGFSENRREIEMDMREMTDRVKKGEPLYGKSTLTEYMQGAASRQSRYAGTFSHVMPWFNFVNHNQHGVDTAKYYRNAERELEAERNGKKL
ncbi:nadh-ubiquinone oxidoreductase 21 kda subunit like protein [Zymoseptoria brevis]|uniref:Nadh-ubiquinone oxidoreductase 21 kDa subunit like protein n=1 Tax=Zymoseptoria brevis TaxID=1047168 RepID=A0A0F4GMN1_9PEZI|nr:nadh-ubiquinone oxidoreductase 21 kda subunit like protein [Zymoseptoria brevis]